MGAREQSRKRGRDGGRVHNVVLATLVVIIGGEEKEVAGPVKALLGQIFARGHARPALAPVLETDQVVKRRSGSICGGRGGRRSGTSLTAEEAPVGTAGGPAQVLKVTLGTLRNLG